jgi:hypothetical protein
MESWLSPPNRIIWIKAFREKATTVTIRDGRKFNIRYRKNVEPFSKSDPNDEWALVSPDKGYAPMAWFKLSTVTDQVWLTEPDSIVAKKESIYVTYLDEFIASDIDGVNVVEQWPGLSSRLASTLRQGFASAKDERGKKANKVIVTMAGGSVFLIKEDANVKI